MKKLVILLIILSPSWAEAQRYKSSSGTVEFYSEELLEDITAASKKVTSIFDSETGQIVFSVPMKSFEFEKSLMKEHFNEKYLESEKFPKATFKGQLSGYQVGQDNSSVVASGQLEIHGIKRNIKVEGRLDFKNDRVIIHSVFFVKLVDYKIKVPKLMFQKIGEEIEVTIELEYEPYEQ